MKTTTMFYCFRIRVARGFFTFRFDFSYRYNDVVNSFFSLIIVSLLIFNIIPINLEIVDTIYVAQAILRVGCHLRMSKIERKYKWNLSIAYAFKEQFST